MHPGKNKVEIENDPETFQKLITLVNFYAQTLSEYQKLLFVLNNLPRHNGHIVLQEDCFEIIQEYIDDYQGVTAYAKKMMDKETPTVH